MEKSKLDCCVVRDLLPAYLEGLTEEGTAELVQGHLAGCPSCQAVKETMAAQVPVEKARRGELNFLKRGRRLRRLSALLAAILVLLGVKWLYGQAFRWTDSEASLGMALEEEVGRIAEGLSHFQVLGTQWDGEELLVLFQAQEAGAARCGTARFQRGWNGRYRFAGADYGPFPYTAGVYVQQMPRDKEGERTYYCIGMGCRDIYSFSLTFDVSRADGAVLRQETLTFPVEESIFVLPVSSLQVPHEGEELVWLDYPEALHLYSRDGTDVTDHYREPQEDAQAGHVTVGVAMANAVYVLMALTALAGCVIVGFLLSPDWRGGKKK